MRPLSGFVLAALLALGWTSLAEAEDQASRSTLDPSLRAGLSGMELDIPFEKAVSPDIQGALLRLQLSGPTRMSCENSATPDAFETCVVMTDGIVASAPASLARH